MTLDELVIKIADMEGLLEDTRKRNNREVLDGPDGWSSPLFNECMKLRDNLKELTKLHDIWVTECEDAALIHKLSQQ